jgi:serpin B
MALNGAAGDTYAEIAQTLGFQGLGEAEINESYKSLVELLRTLDPSIEMDVANSVWHDQFYQIQPTFSSTLSDYFDAAVFSRSFASPSTVTDINDWVSARTNGKIPTIIDQIQDNEIMFLINAIYFRGDWRVPFDPGLTQSAEFRTLDSRQVPVRMMSRESNSHEFIFGQDLVAANLTYGNGAFAMALLMPNDSRDVNELIRSMSIQQWNSIRARFSTGRAMLRMPKFELEYKRTLNDDLKAMGMELPFLPGEAEFPRMIMTDSDLYISRVEHRAAVDVDEIGTTAAAATAIGIGIVSAPPQLDFDRPFLFLIYERISGTLLFLGKVVEP